MVCIRQDDTIWTPKVHTSHFKVFSFSLSELLLEQWEEELLARLLLEGMAHSEEAGKLEPFCSPELSWDDFILKAQQGSWSSRFDLKREHPGKSILNKPA